MEPVFLRAIECDDIERTYKWHNDPELYESLVGNFHFTSRTSEEEWLRKMQAYSTQNVNLAICTSSNSEHIGNIYLRDIDWVARHGELHIFIGEHKHRSKGLGQSAVRLLLKYAFEQLGLIRIFLLVLEGNDAAVRAYEKCGFIVEGKLRRHAFKGGAYKDVLIMGVCREDTN